MGRDRRRTRATGRRPRASARGASLLVAVRVPPGTQARVTSPPGARTSTARCGERSARTASRIGSAGLAPARVDTTPRGGCAKPDGADDGRGMRPVRRSRRLSGEDLGGKRSPREDRPTHRRKRTVRGTDSTVEQGLEVDRPGLARPHDPGDGIAEPEWRAFGSPRERVERLLGDDPAGSCAARRRRRDVAPTDERRRVAVVRVLVRQSSPAPGEASPQRRRGRPRRQELRGWWPTPEHARSAAARSGRNDKRATTAVTRHGCCRGEAFEGYEPHRRESSTRPSSAGPGHARADPMSRRQGRESGNAVNLMAAEQDETSLPGRVWSKPSRW